MFVQVLLPNLPDLVRFRRVQFGPAGAVVGGLAILQIHLAIDRELCGNQLGQAGQDVFDETPEIPMPVSSAD